MQIGKFRQDWRGGMRLVKQLSPWVLAGTLAACGGGSFEPMFYELEDGAPVHITVADGPYAAGAMVPFSVHNQSDFDYVWNPCCRGVERREGDSWLAVGEEERWCPQVGWLLKGGDRATGETDLPTPLPAGEYRFVLSFSRPSGDRNVEDFQVSNSFIVTP
jgi:hypothetical protein